MIRLFPNASELPAQKLFCICAREDKINDTINNIFITLPIVPEILKILSKIINGEIYKVSNLYQTFKATVFLLF